ncbi:MAG: DNA-binding protein, partial [Bacteroidota bacterium]
QPEENYLADAQLSRYIGTNDEYLCFTITRASHPSPNKNVSVTLGLLLSPAIRQKIQFIDDPNISIEDVHTTCERCAVIDCKERATEPNIYLKKDKINKIQERISLLTD